MVKTDDTRRTTDNVPGVWQKLPTVELTIGQVFFSRLSNYTLYIKTKYMLQCVFLQMTFAVAPIVILSTSTFHSTRRKLWQKRHLV